jgi:hypothetical protein
LLLLFVIVVVVVDVVEMLKKTATEYHTDFNNTLFIFASKTGDFK